LKLPSRRSLHVGALLLLLAGGLPRAAWAEWQITPLIGFTFRGSTTLVSETDEFTPGAHNVHWNFGGSVALIGSWPIGVEALFLFTPGFLEREDAVQILQSSRTTALMGNLVLATPRSWNEYGLRPFVSGGFGLLRTSAEDPPANLWENPINLFGFNIGGGAVGFITDRTGLRFDLRYFRHVRPAEAVPVISFGDIELSYWNAALGVVFRY
jgi:hypothetical protein